MNPCDADRELTLAVAAALIESAFPSMDSRDLRFLGAGCEFDAYLTIDGWVVRFPRRTHAALLFERERRVHVLVAPVLPQGIAVPQTEFIGEPALGFPYRFAAHRFIPGIPVDETDSRFLPSLARQIALALGAIHSVPEEAAREAGITDGDAGDEGGREWLKERLAGLSLLRGSDPIVDGAARWVEQTPIPSGRFDGPLCLIHQDLSPEHLLVDPANGQLNGILDWTDAMLGDAARDFVFLAAWRGWAYTEEVLRHYPHQVDTGFRDRLRFMARVLTPLWLGLAYERGTEVGKLTGWVHNVFAPELHGIQSRRRP
jgi:aminoglycoside phosphotransferase (APT) family kinase protein